MCFTVLNLAVFNVRLEGGDYWQKQLFQGDWTIGLMTEIRILHLLCITTICINYIVVSYFCKETVFPCMYCGGIPQVSMFVIQYM